MKRKFRYFSLLAGVSSFAFTVAGMTACGGGSTTLASMRLSETYVELNVGESSKISASVSPKSFADTPAEWFTSDSSVAVVQNGTIFAVGEGSAEIRAFVPGVKKLPICNVQVNDDGVIPVGEDSLRLNIKTKEIALNGSFSITYAVYPANTPVSFRSDNENIATVTQDGLVTGVSAGTTTIIATSGHETPLFASCSVIVKDSSETIVDVIPDDEKHLTGSIRVGAPANQQTFVKTLLDDFNTTHESNISFSLVKWEEDKAAENMANPKDGPDVFPYASDQTFRLFARNSLAVLPDANITWIKTSMGEEAKTYATLKGVNKVVGYPFAADNGAVMFYDKAVVSDPSEIDTIDKLFNKAVSTGREVDFALTNGFYASGALMTYTGGQTLYDFRALAGGTYQATSTFNSEEGLRGARLVSTIFNKPKIMDAAEAPTATTKVLATITDASKVASFKGTMKTNYGVTALPKVSSDPDAPRVGIFLGYKFYGVNPAKGSGAAHLQLQHIIAKYLANKYCQEKRFETFYTKPTLTELQTLATSEEHVVALNTHITEHAYIPLTAVDSALWAQTMNAAKDIKNGGVDITDAQLIKILGELDTQLNH